jgi:8-oxo-dGTP pyrophosphatase MutT (NUDIX family)
MGILPGQKMNKPSILKVQKDLSNPWFEQIEKTIILPGDSEPQIYYSIKPHDYVTVLAQTNEKKIIILKQYRPAVEDFTFEFPSGHLEEGETPTQAVIRELKEETNCEAENLILMGEVIPDTGRLENRLWAFYAGNIVVNDFPHPDENDGIEVNLVSTDKLFNMINDGTFRHALDLSVVTLAITKKYFKF